MPRRILLVEDNPDQLELTVRALARTDPAYEVITARDGEGCLEALRGGRFDAVLLDFSLPRMDGLGVLAGIKEQGYDLPVIMVTGQGNERIAVEAMKRGASDYVVKTAEYTTALPTLVEKVLSQQATALRLRRAEERLHLLKDLSVALSMKLKLEELAQDLVEGACRLVKAQAGMVVFLRPGKMEGEISATTGLTMPPDSLLGPLGGKGAIGRVLEERTPVLITDMKADPKAAGMPVHQPALKETLGIPIRRQNEMQGVVIVGSPEAGPGFEPEDVEVLTSLCTHAASVLANARYVQQMEQLAITDHLTGLFNHREFQRRLAEEIERSRRYLCEFSLLMVDIDHFKVFNDTYGHPVGDQVLQQVSKIIKEQLRNVDIPFRYGGEEFTIILPETINENAETVADRIREAISRHPFLTPVGEAATLSVSIGVASCPLDATEREEIITVADQALYFAKEAGRNRICRYSRTLKASIERSPEALLEILRNPTLRAAKELAAAVDAKSPYTRGHSFEVTRYALLLAEALGLSDAEKENLRLASLLHNIGTVTISEKILNKPGPLTVEEKKMIQSHPGLAEMMLTKIQDLDSVIPAILYHHERFDGIGYPNSLKGDKIPYLARVLSVVEAYQAMISIRPYRRRLSREEAIEELRQNAGTQFDPHMVEVFISVLTQEGGGSE